MTRRYVIVESVTRKTASKRLSDDEIASLRAAQFERQRALRSAWNELEFGVSRFDAVVDFARKAGGERWVEKTAWVAASRGYLNALDVHSTLITKAGWDDSTKKTSDGAASGTSPSWCS